ncbi:hypothetical protein Pcinc_026118 [Petrolisthes cinctipes]|uniref:CHK kinase-like domain-containing protein n=1 Tax=Petrolisthes cinctipes TaxID=88211 RepID=A0AAE1KC34_PETCI|nr:hypothetical protein Pcinc_026118 [Petrolisthes cinctipes]
MGEDGIPIVIGVRVPDNDDDDRIYRNARIINNKLVTQEGRNEGMHEGENEGRGFYSRQARILWSQNGGRSPFGQSSYESRSGVVAEASEEIDNLSTSSEQVVSYSYRTAPEHSESQRVIYGSGSADKPDSNTDRPREKTQSPKPSPSRRIQPIKPSKSDPYISAAPSRDLRKGLHDHILASPSSLAHVAPSRDLRKGLHDHSRASPSSLAHVAPSRNLRKQTSPKRQPLPPLLASQSAVSFVSTSGDLGSKPAQVTVSNPSPFGHVHESFAVHHDVGPEQAHNDDFVIKDSLFQSHPGAPVFSIPIPVPSQQFKGSQGKVEKDREREKEKPFYMRLMEPLQKLGQRIYKAASPMFSPIQRIANRFHIPDRVQEVSETWRLDELSKTVDSDNLPLVAGVGAIAALGLVGLAIASSSNNSLVIGNGKRSIQDATFPFIYGPAMAESRALLAGAWDSVSDPDGDGGDGGTRYCAKRLLCQLMSFMPNSYRTKLEENIIDFTRSLPQEEEKKTEEEVNKERGCSGEYLAVELTSLITSLGTMSAEATEKRDPLSLITEQHVKSALRKDKGDEAQLLTWNINNFTKKGDNLATVVTSVVIDYHLGSETHQTSYIIKLNPCITSAFTDSFTNMVFEKEVNFYEEILPDLNHMLKNAGQELLRMPELFHSSLEENKELIILKDLRRRGFVMVEKFKGQDEAHVMLALKELSRLHASSILLQAKAPDTNLSERYPSLDKDIIYCTGEKKEKLQKMFSGGYNNAIMILKSCERHTAAAWLERNLPNVLDLFQEHLEKIPPFKVICHGDFNNNNILFRYNEVGDPLEVMIIDNQVTRVASPATDLAYFLYTCVRGDIRKAKLQDFLGVYYSTFSSMVEVGGVAVPFTLSELKQEFQKRMMYGLLICLLFVPYYLGENVEVPSPEEFMSENSKENLEAWRQNLKHSLHDNPNLNYFCLVPVDEFLEAGVIS